MASLFLVGNINEKTFANAALAAHIRDRDLGGVGLRDVFVLHSPESEQHLAARSDWIDYLSTYGLSRDVFVSCTVDLHRRQEAQISQVARHVERFILALDAKDDVYVDLTNGSSLYKSVLANVAFILGVRRQFILEVRGENRFLAPEELRSAYVELPDPSGLDSVAPAWLTEVRRFNVKAREASRTLTAICGADSSRATGFEGEIENAVRSWFRGEKKYDGAALGGAVRHIGRAFEDLIQGVYERIYKGPGKGQLRLKNMLGQLCSHLAESAPEYEPQLIEEISQLLRSLRNDATHEQSSTELGLIRARLSTELLFSTADYFRVLHELGLLQPSSAIPESDRGRYAIEGRRGQSYYFGIDGDDTGRELELLFQSSSTDKAFSRFSSAIDEAMKSIATAVKKAPIHGQVLFCSGDDLLFRGAYRPDELEGLRSNYAHISGGRTCSIGFGRTPKEAYVALKMAKATPGKNCVRGVELVSQIDMANF